MQVVVRRQDALGFDCLLAEPPTTRSVRVQRPGRAGVAESRGVLVAMAPIAMGERALVGKAGIRIFASGNKMAAYAVVASPHLASSYARATSKFTDRSIALRARHDDAGELFEEDGIQLVEVEAGLSLHAPP